METSILPSIHAVKCQSWTDKTFRIFFRNSPKLLVSEWPQIKNSESVQFQPSTQFVHFRRFIISQTCYHNDTTSLAKISFRTHTQIYRILYTVYNIQFIIHIRHFFKTRRKFVTKQCYEFKLWSPMYWLRAFYMPNIFIHVIFCILRMTSLYLPPKMTLNFSVLHLFELLWWLCDIQSTTKSETSTPKKGIIYIQ